MGLLGFLHTDIADTYPPIILRYAELSARRSLASQNARIINRDNVKRNLIRSSLYESFNDVRNLVDNNGYAETNDITIYFVYKNYTCIKYIFNTHIFLFYQSSSLCTIYDQLFI